MALARTIDDPDLAEPGSASAPSDAWASKLVGRELGHDSRGRPKYKLEKLLGVGGFGAVFAARHLIVGRPCAVKVLRPDLSVDPSQQRKFTSEALKANSVEHDAVVKIEDADVDGGLTYLVMPLLEGEDLEARAARSDGHLDLELVLDSMEALLEVLEAAHAKRVIHRDVKPSNLFLTVRGDLRVFDFGIAMVIDADMGEGSKSSGGAALGTADYMAPEQALGQTDRIGSPTDIYGVGATMFRLLTGRTVHDGESDMQVRVKVATRAAPSLSTLWEDAPTELVALVDRALESRPEDRFSTASAMLRELRRVKGRVLEASKLFVLTPSAKRAEPRSHTVGQSPAAGLLASPAERPRPGRGLGLGQILGAKGGSPADVPSKEREEPTVLMSPQEQEALRREMAVDRRAPPRDERLRGGQAPPPNVRGTLPMTPGDQQAVQEACRAEASRDAGRDGKRRAENSDECDDPPARIFSLSELSHLVDPPSVRREPARARVSPLVGEPAGEPRAAIRADAGEKRVAEPGAAARESDRKRRLSWVPWVIAAFAVTVAGGSLVLGRSPWLDGSPGPAKSAGPVDQAHRPPPYPPSLSSGSSTPLEAGAEAQAGVSRSADMALKPPKMSSDADAARHRGRHDAGARSRPAQPPVAPTDDEEPPPPPSPPLGDDGIERKVEGAQAPVQ
jgi:serine/threonine protein kinase